MTHADGPPTLLSTAQLEVELGRLGAWRQDGDALVRDLKLASFGAAIDCINDIAELAEAADHHPELRNVYRDLSVRLSTHAAGGITMKDVELATAIDQLPGLDG